MITWPDASGRPDSQLRLTSVVFSQICRSPASLVVFAVALGDYQAALERRTALRPGAQQPVNSQGGSQ